MISDNKNNYKMYEYLSFRELKNELKLCKNKNDELVIRKIMKQKAIKYKLKKRNNKIEPSVNKNNNSTTDDLIKNILKDIDDNDSLCEEDILAENKNNKDTKDKKKFIKKDMVNNSLMERMNGELNIRKGNRKNKKEFLMPFTENPGSDYASFNNNTNSISNFSNFKK